VVCWSEVSIETVVTQVESDRIECFLWTESAAVLGERVAEADIGCKSSPEGLENARG
jgi:hypothetical protein